MRKRSKAEVVRITGARQGLTDDVRGRQRRYVISMSVRTVSVVLAAVLWNVERHVAIVALALGILLPYIAVVIANAGRENVPTLPSAYVPTPVRPAIEPMAGTAPPQSNAGSDGEADAEGGTTAAAGAAARDTTADKSERERAAN